MPAMDCANEKCQPKNVGILALEISFPKYYVCQTELEEFDNVSAGKYTIGLGQKNMSFCHDLEDVNSMCLTALSKLMRKHAIGYDEVGRLDVGTESMTDKSKSIKSVLMQLFEESGNFDVEGIDNINACYGATAALFNAVNWIESSSWDGRYAVAVAGDNAVYEKGPARPTGGAGAIAMLIGPNAPLVLDQGLRTSHMKHVYDFYKPNLASEYPVVDGPLSIQCYFEALQSTYQGYFKKALNSKDAATDINHFDGLIFHSPYCKLVQKSFARLMYIDSTAAHPKNTYPPELDIHRSKPLCDTYFDKDLEKAYIKASNEYFNQKTKKSLLLASEVGNMYTPSVYAGLISYLLSENAENLAGRKIGVFSYGSGLASTFYSISIIKDYSDGSALQKCLAGLSEVKDMLANRIKVAPKEFNGIMEEKQKAYNTAPFYPSACCSLSPGTWTLNSIDDKRRRHYKKMTCEASLQCEQAES